MSYLTIQPAQGKKSKISFDSDLIRVGRSSRNEVHLASDPSLSRFHAEFSRVGEDYYVRDAGSRNGTSLNDKQLTEPVRMQPGDRVTLGETVIFFSSSGTDAAVRLTDDHPTGGPGQNTLVLPLADIISSNVTGPGGQANSQASTEQSNPQSRAFAVLARAANELLAHRSLNDTFEVILDMVFEALTPDRGTIMLLEGEAPALQSQVVRDARSSGDGGIQLSRTIADAVVKEQQSVMIQDARTDERFAAQESIQIQGIHSALCVPLWNNREVIGLLYVDTLGIPGKFQQDDLRLLTLLANLAAVKIENVKLFVKAEKQREMEQELQAAAKIQRRLLPAGDPEVAGYQLTGYNIPCKGVGGDYFDFYALEGDRMGLAIGDVSGKGMAAALMMASVQASFRAHASADLEIPELIRRLNKAVAANSMSNKFMTFFYGVLNTATGALQYTNAGHNPPMLFRASGSVEELTGGGMILGVLSDADYLSQDTSLTPGDVLVLFSDGITESQNEQEEQFGEERLMEVVRSCMSETAPGVVRCERHGPGFEAPRRRRCQGIVEERERRRRAHAAATLRADGGCGRFLRCASSLDAHGIDSSPRLELDSQDPSAGDTRRKKGPPCRWPARNSSPPADHRTRRPGARLLRTACDHTCRRFRRKPGCRKPCAHPRRTASSSSNCSSSPSRHTPGPRTYRKQR